MKTQKNKIVFALVLVCVVLFITIYGIMTFGKDKKTELDPERIPMPDLDGGTVEYKSKLEALDAIKEVKENRAPQLYPEHMVDEKGYFNPDYMEYKKQRMIDSIYQSPTFEPSPVSVLGKSVEPQPIGVEGEGDTVGRNEDVRPFSMKDRALLHQLFFAAHPNETKVAMLDAKKLGVMAYVDGDQTLRDGHRLELRLGQDLQQDGFWLAKHTRIYGFVKIRPNRVMVDLPAFGDNGILWRAYDLQDGQEGIYLENHLKGELLEKGLDETIGEVNVPGLPQIGGLNRIFQRHNRAIKVEVKGNYQLMLKSTL